MIDPNDDLDQKPIHLSAQNDHTHLVQVRPHSPTWSHPPTWPHSPGSPGPPVHTHLVHLTHLITPTHVTLLTHLITTTWSHPLVTAFPGEPSQPGLVHHQGWQHTCPPRCKEGICWCLEGDVRRGQGGALDVTQRSVFSTQALVTGARNRFNNNSPLHLATEGGHIEAVKIMLENGVCFLFQAHMKVKTSTTF